MILGVLCSLPQSVPQSVFLSNFHAHGKLLEKHSGQGLKCTSYFKHSVIFCHILKVYLLQSVLEVGRYSPVRSTGTYTFDPLAFSSLFLAYQHLSKAAGTLLCLSGFAELGK